MNVPDAFREPVGLFGLKPMPPKETHVMPPERLAEFLAPPYYQGAEVYNAPIEWAIRQGVTLEVRAWSNTERYLARLGSHYATGNSARHTLARLQRFLSVIKTTHYP
jgi:hypothetical protein